MMVVVPVTVMVMVMVMVMVRAMACSNSNGAFGQMWQYVCVNLFFLCLNHFKQVLLDFFGIPREEHLIC